MGEKSLERMIFKTVDIPALPSVVDRSLSLLNKNDVTIQELEDAVAADQAFTAKLLRVANSPFYGMSREVDTISGAIKLIGLSAVKSLVLSISFKDLHRHTEEIDQILWGHSVAVAGVAEAVSKYKGLHFEDELFVSGLLHDIGKTIINHSDASAYKEALAMVRENGMSFSEAETEIYGFDHCKVGGYIARKWKLPKRLEDVIENHHPESYPLIINETSTIHNVIWIADLICWEMGIGVDKPIKFTLPQPKVVSYPRVSDQQEIKETNIFDLLNIGKDEVEDFKKSLIMEYEKHNMIFIT
jgi:putative nucleotidyltransferase with HDIG domain